MAPRVTQVRASPGKATEGADGVPGRPGRESGARWGQRCHQSCGQSVSKRMVRGFGRRAALRAVGGHRRSPSWLVGTRIHGFGRAGGHRGGRRKPVHGGLAAASMPRTPPRCPPARPLTGSCAASHGRQNKKSKAKAGRFTLQCLTSEISLVAGQRPALPQSIHAWRGSTADRGNLSGAGWWGPAGPLAPWMAPSSPHGWVYGVSCWPPSPRQPTEYLLLPWPWPLLLLLLLPLPLPWPRRVPGAARPKPTPRFRYNVGPVSQLRFPGHDGPRGRARPVAVPPRTS